MARMREEDHYTPLEWAQKQVTIARQWLAKALEKERHEWRRQEWRKGYFTYEDEDNIPSWFRGLDKKLLERWHREGYGPQSRRPKQNWIEIQAMHDFLWCRDIREFPRGRRRFINGLRCDRLNSQVLHIEDMLKGLTRMINGQSPDSNWRDPGAWKRQHIEGEPCDGFKTLEEKLPMFKTTGDLRSAMIKLYGEVESGAVTAAVARTKVQVARTIVDTLKVEIAAANLGKQFGLVRFDEIENNSIRRVA